MPMEQVLLQKKAGRPGYKESFAKKYSVISPDPRRDLPDECYYSLLVAMCSLFEGIINQINVYAFVEPFISIVSVPSGVDIIGDKYQLSPSIKHAQLKILQADVWALRFCFEYVIQPIIVRREG